eukprot:TRINITY_DN1555_c0_g1_i1.p2 TRINITY_DN1555_c0_g1~~TRINITY_DN1555_c0_g1_i1.p2  ORF type:complete len:415 (-),score=157.80 TRINITY_DN1555_c0_g1_i1:13-1257(-)
MGARENEPKRPIFWLNKNWFKNLERLKPQKRRKLIQQQNQRGTQKIFKKLRNMQSNQTNEGESSTTEVASGSISNYSGPTVFPPPAYFPPKDEDASEDNSSDIYHGPAHLDSQGGFNATNDANSSFSMPSANEYSGAEWTCHLAHSDWIKKNPEGRLIFNLHTIIPKIHIQSLSANRFFHSKDRLKPHEWTNFTKFDKFMSGSSSKVGSVYNNWKEKVYSGLLSPYIPIDEGRPFVGIDPNLVNMIEEKQEDRTKMEEDRNELNKEVISEPTVEEVSRIQEPEAESQLTPPHLSLEEERNLGNEEDENSINKKRKRAKKTITDVKRNTAIKRANQMVEKMRKICEEEQESFEDVLDIYILKNHPFLEGRIQKFGRDASKKKIQKVYCLLKDALEKKQDNVGVGMMDAQQLPYTM